MHPTHRPQVVAHRGSNTHLAEHTLAAYERAIAEGADALECDVRLTADGVAVCVHDRTIERTSDGYGVVSIKTYGELSERDFGAHRRPEAAEPEADHEVHRLLTLEHLLDLVVSTPRPIDIAIETKHPVRYAGLVEERIIAILNRFGLAHPVSGMHSRARMMSFSEVAGRRTRTLAPGIPTVFLMDHIPLRCRSGWLPGGARIAGPGIHVVRAHPEYVDRVHKLGFEVHVWTVDAPGDVELCVELGVEAIITNRPGDVITQLNTYPREL